MLETDFPFTWCSITFKSNCLNTKYLYYIMIWMRHDMSGNFDMLWSTAFKWPDSRILPQPYYIHTKNGKERYDTVFCVPLNFNISCVIWFFVWLNKHKTFCSLQDGHLPSNLPCMRCKAQVTGQWASTKTQLSFEMWYPHLQSSCRARVNLAPGSQLRSLYSMQGGTSPPWGTGVLSTHSLSVPSM